MEKLTSEQGFVATCWSKVLFMNFEQFKEMAEQCLDEEISDIDDPKIWERLKEKTKEDFKILVDDVDIEAGT